MISKWQLTVFHHTTHPPTPFYHHTKIITLVVMFVALMIIPNATIIIHYLSLQSRYFWFVRWLDVHSCLLSLSGKNITFYFQENEFSKKNKWSCKQVSKAMQLPSILQYPFFPFHSFFQRERKKLMGFLVLRKEKENNKRKRK